MPFGNKNSLFLPLQLDVFYFFLPDCPKQNLQDHCIHFEVVRADILELFLILRESMQTFTIRNYVISRLFPNLNFMRLKEFPSILRML